MIALAIFAGYFFISVKLNAFELPRLKYSDFYFKIAKAIRGKPAALNDIVVVAIDDESLDKIKEQLPWSRRRLAELIDKIDFCNPKATAMNIVLFGEGPDIEGNDILRNSLAKARRPVVLSSYFGTTQQKLLPYKPFLDVASGCGFLDKPLDADGIVRRASAAMVTLTGVAIDYSFELRGVAAYLGVGMNDIKHEGLSVNLYKKGAKVLSMPINQKGEYVINYMVDPEDIVIVPAWKVLNDTDGVQRLLRGKLVIVGANASAVHDFYDTPFGKFSSLLIISSAILTVLSGKVITYLPFWVNISALFILSLAATILSYRLSLLKGFFFSLLISLGYMGINLYLFMNNLWWDFVSPLVLIGTVFFGFSCYKYSVLFFENMRLKDLAVTDALTGLYGFRYFEMKLKVEFDKAAIEGKNLSVMMIDIDHFKNINDTYGHEAGNVILKSLAQLLKGALRETDILMRFGGEEFVVISIGLDLKAAKTLGERLRQAVEANEFKIPDKALKLTISLGASSRLESRPRSTKELVEFADKALYTAKNTGRNKLCLYSPP